MGHFDRAFGNRVDHFEGGDQFARSEDVDGEIAVRGFVYIFGQRFAAAINGVEAGREG